MLNSFDEARYSEYEIESIPVDRIRPNPYQPRRVFDNIALNDLTASIKEYGVMQPISVRRLNSDMFELIAGERRLRASKLAGLSRIPAVVVNVSDRDSAVIALIENLQRENLNYFEESEGYANLIQDYGLTQEDVAKKVGKSQSTIANKLRLLKLSQEIKKKLIENNLTERHARALLKLPEEKMQLQILDKVIKLGLTVKKTEELIKKYIEDIINKDNKEEKKKKIKRYIKDIRLFTNTVERAVDVMKDAGVNVKYDITKNDEDCEITIRIPYN